jgi:hypothetical protein
MEEEILLPSSDMTFESDDLVVEQDSASETTNGDRLSYSPVINYIADKFSEAETKRRFDENRWLSSYRNYRGVYSAESVFSEHEKSRVFVKITKTKVTAAYGQIIEVLYGNHKFPLTVEPTELPEGVVESAHISLQPSPPGMSDLLNPKPKTSGWRFKGTGEVIPQEISDEGFDGRFGYLKDLVEPLQGELVEGPGTTPETVTFHPALVAAKKMQKKILDQLQESNADKHLRSMAFECALFGTGVLSGPFVVDKEYPRWVPDEQGSLAYSPVIKTVPEVEAVSVWDSYPDPQAVCQEDAEYFIRRRKMSRTQLEALKSRPFFRNNQISGLISDGPNYTMKWWETALEDGFDNRIEDRWEVMEFWGFVPIEELREFGIKIPKQFRKTPQLNANIWVSGGRVLRVVLNPFKPARIPFYAVPYELNPYSYFGVGVAENMADAQMLINGFTRMAVDNQALSGNLVFEVDSSNLAPGQDLTVYPGKVFVRESGAPGQALFGTQFPNVSQQNLMLVEQARMWADEATGLPSYIHGQTGVQNTGRTASGISMLMNAAHGSIRTVIKNFDDYLLQPLGKAYFAFNMQFDPDPTIKGDLEIHARGTESLMANEVRSQRLMQFLSVLQNEATMPFGKIDYIVREIAKSLDLDPDKTVNNMADAAVMAKLMQSFAPPDPAAQGGGAMPPGSPTPPQGGDASAAAGANPMDATGVGGGNMGVGQTPLPGEDAFSARKNS